MSSSADQYKPVTIEKTDLLKYFRAALVDQLIHEEEIQWRKLTKAEKVQCKKDNIDIPEKFQINLEEVLENITTIHEAITLFQQKKGQRGNWNPRLCNEERVHIIAKVIIKDLEHLGFFICDQYGILHYFDEDEARVYQISEGNEINPEFEAIINLRYNLRKKNKTVYTKILSHAQLFHVKRDVYRLWYYSKEEGILFVYGGNNHYFKLNGKTIERFINGTHILFKESKGIVGKEYIPLEEREKDIKIKALQYSTPYNCLNFLINRCNFTENTNLTPNQQRLQLAIQLFALPFASIINTKPIMLMYGERGSGKSFTLQTWGKFLFNINYSLSILPDNIKDYTVALANRPVYFTDNVDDYVKWLPEVIVAVASGACLPQRELYTNWTLTERLPQSFLAFTTRTATSFKRDDVVDRSLLFHVDRIEEYIDEVDLWQPLEEFHNDLYSEFLDCLNQIIYTLKTIGGLSLPTKHRLAGWAKFAKIVNIALALDQLYRVDFDVFLNAVMHEKASFLFRDKALLPLLKQYAVKWPDEWRRATEIIEKIKELDDSFEMTPQKFGKIISTRFRELKLLVGFASRDNSLSKSKEYIFGEKYKQNGEKKKNRGNYVPDVRDVLIPFALLQQNNQINIVMYKEYIDHIPNLRYFCQNEKQRTVPENQLDQLYEFIFNFDGEKGIKFEKLKDHFMINQGWELKPITEGLVILLADGFIYESIPGRYKILK